MCKCTITEQVTQQFASSSSIWRLFLHGMVERHIHKHMMCWWGLKFFETFQCLLTRKITEHLGFSIPRNKQLKWILSKRKNLINSSIWLLAESLILFKRQYSLTYLYWSNVKILINNRQCLLFHYFFWKFCCRSNRNRSRSSLHGWSCFWGQSWRFPSSFTLLGVALKEKLSNI